MELALARALALSTWENLRQQSVELCARCTRTIGKSQEQRARYRLARQEHQTATVGSNIRRKLRGRRLPRVWPLILSADSGSGAMCDACDQPLLPAHMMMTLRGRDQFVRFHADCFLLWNDIRSETTAVDAEQIGRA